MSQGIAEVNWGILKDARRFGVGYVATGRVVVLGGVEAAEHRERMAEPGREESISMDDHPMLPIAI